MARTPTTAIPLGFTAPDFQLPDTVSGSMMSRDDLMTGGPSIVVFMCNHCPFVVHILEEFVAFAAEYKAKGVNVVAISSNENVISAPWKDWEEFDVGSARRVDSNACTRLIHLPSHDDAPCIGFEAAPLNSCTTVFTKVFSTK